MAACCYFEADAAVGGPRGFDPGPRRRGGKEKQGPVVAARLQCEGILTCRIDKYMNTEYHQMQVTAFGPRSERSLTLRQILLVLFVADFSLTRRVQVHCGRCSSASSKADFRRAGRLCVKAGLSRT